MWKTNGNQIILEIMLNEQKENNTKIKASKTMPNVHKVKQKFVQRKINVYIFPFYYLILG